MQSIDNLHHSETRGVSEVDRKPDLMQMLSVCSVDVFTSPD